MSTPRQIQLAQQADSPLLETALQSLQAHLFAAAEANVMEAISDDPNAYGALQRRAMVVTEALRLTSGMELSTIITRGQLIRQIETEGLVGVHPNGYANLTALSQENGISTAELSDIRAMYDVIFPYIVETLQRSLPEVWEQIGKSAFREMVPALRSLITGDQADHASVRQAVEGMLSNSAASIMASGVPQGELDEVEVRRTAIENLLTAGATLTVRQVRRAVRPARVPSVPMATLEVSESQWYAVMKISSREQYDLIQRILNPHTDNSLLNGRQVDRSWFELLFGDTE